MTQANDKQQFQALIFDFDGTIVDTFPKTVEIMNNIADSYGFQKCTLPIKQLRQTHTHDILKLFHISIFKLPFIYRKVQHILTQGITKLDPIPEIKQLLKQLDNSDYLVGIVSSNIGENVHKFMEYHGMEDWIDFSYTNVFPYTKNWTFYKVFKQQEIEPPFCLYVGDEDRDIKAAHKVNMPVAAVTWGYNSREILEKCQPDYLIDTVEELKKIIKI